MERDWKKIQEYYDDNHTWEDVIKNFKMADKTLIKAIKNKLFKTRTRSQAIKISYIKKPRIHSEETKKRISNARKKYLIEHPDKVPYLLNHYSKGESYPEKYFEKILKKENLKYDRYLQISIYNLDFAFSDKKIDLEIDGDQHYFDPRILESNKNRDNYLNSLGWKIIRLKWSDYKKYNMEQKEETIKKLIKKIK